VGKRAGDALDAPVMPVFITKEGRFFPAYLPVRASRAQDAPVPALRTLIPRSQGSMRILVMQCTHGVAHGIQIDSEFPAPKLLHRFRCRAANLGRP
jgi:hypothetical protein